MKFCLLFVISCSHRVYILELDIKFKWNGRFDWINIILNFGLFKFSSPLSTPYVKVPEKCNPVNEFEENYYKTTYLYQHQGQFNLKFVSGVWTAGLCIYNIKPTTIQKKSFVHIFK